jgi:hypothetical protein
MSKEENIALRPMGAEIGGLEPAVTDSSFCLANTYKESKAHVSFYRP